MGKSNNDLKKGYATARDLDERVAFQDSGETLRDIYEIFDPLNPNVYVITTQPIHERDIRTEPEQLGGEDEKKRYLQISLLPQNIFGRISFIYIGELEIDLEFFPGLDTVDKMVAFLENPDTNGMHIIPYTYNFKSEDKCPFTILGAYDAEERRAALGIRELERLERIRLLK